MTLETETALVDSYRAALEAYAAGDGEHSLAQAYEIGRRALAAGLGVLEMVTIHYEALQMVPGARNETAQSFLAECLSPFEMVHRGVQEANSALRHTTEALENEARRIAHVLHDEAGQMLVSVYIAVEQLSRRLPPELRPELSEVRERLDFVEERLRRLSHELRPPILDHLGLLPALRFLVEGVSERSGLDACVEGDLEPRLPAPIEITIYRVVQESLTNVVRHAHASKVTVRAWRELDTVHCTVEDDGVGFDAAAPVGTSGGPSLGLVGIRERVRALDGAIRIHSAQGRGTTLEVTVPVKEQGSWHSES